MAIPIRLAKVKESGKETEKAMGLIVDLFAGGGGASTGLEMAFGRSPDIAVNHDAEALAVHRANHPRTRHLCANVLRVMPRDATQGQPVDWLHASPDCTHFSNAKGGKPRSLFIRDLAWVVVRWAEDVHPAVISLENVKEFLSWGPLDRNGRPIKSQSGSIFRAWVRCLLKLGYKVAWRTLRACDYGAPTTRARLFIVARLDGRPPVWPEPTHGDPMSPAVLAGKLLPWRTAAECIDWSQPTQSIFERRKPLAPNTLRRIAEGIRRYVLHSPAPFLVQYNGTSPPQPVDDPMPTVPTRDRFGNVTAVVGTEGHYDEVCTFLRAHGTIGPDAEAEVVLHGATYRIVDICLRMLRPRELYRAQGFLDSYIIAPVHNGKPLTTTAQVRMCGNSVPPQFVHAIAMSNFPIRSREAPVHPMLHWAARENCALRA
jgi:DNA (cytosine-5)-methyltransferase 1